MTDQTTTRRYFVADGPDAKALIEQLLFLQKEHADRATEFLAPYGAKYFMQIDGWPSAILLDEGSPIPDGFKKSERQHYNGKVYDVLKPVGNTKAGREIKKRAKIVGFFKPSELICKHYGCHNQMVYQGGSMWVAVGWPSKEKGLVVISVPVSEDQPFTPLNSELREIKKSEYIAITEE